MECFCWCRTSQGLQHETLEQALQADASESSQRANKIFAQIETNDDYLRYPFTWTGHQLNLTPEISYAFNTVTTNLLPCNPLPGEYYLELQLLMTNVWKGSKFCAGHFAHITGQHHDKGFSEPSFIEAIGMRSLTAECDPN